MTRKSKLTSWLLEFQEVSGICYFLALFFVCLDRCIRLLVHRYVCWFVRPIFSSLLFRSRFASLLFII